jgi:hypothetical protein
MQTARHVVAGLTFGIGSALMPSPSNDALARSYGSTEAYRAAYAACMKERGYRVDEPLP